MKHRQNISIGSAGLRLSSWLIFLWPYTESHFFIPLLLQLLLDVILIICCLFNSASVLLISVALCQCHSVTIFFSPLSFSNFLPQTLSESLSTPPPSSGLPSSPSWTTISLSLGLVPPLFLHDHLSGSMFSLHPHPPGLCPPLLHLYPLLSLSLSPFISLLPGLFGHLSFAAASSDPGG